MKRNNNYLGRNFKRSRSVDKLSKKRRSFLMSRIRSTNTLFEIKFIKLFRARIKLKITINNSKILGKPDIVIPKKKACVFLDSDFWHGWYYPKWRHLLKDDFWRSKISRNRQRDKYVTRKLRKQGWIVVRIWEHQIKREPDLYMDKILLRLKKL